MVYFPRKKIIEQTPGPKPEVKEATPVANTKPWSPSEVPSEGK